MTLPLRLSTIAAAAVVAAAMSWPQSGMAETMKWKMATSWSGGPLMDIGAKAFADQVKFATEGRVEIEVFPGGTLGKALDVTETVRNGVAQVGHTWMGYDWGKSKTTVLFGGFAGSMDSERMLHWLYAAGGIDLWRQFRQEKFGVVSMPLFIRTAEAFLHSRVPVRTLDDLKGLKLRTAGAWLEISKELGAAPVTMPGGDVYPALERGAIDATEWGTLYEDIAPGFYKIAKYVIIPGIHQPCAPFEVMFNEDAWNSLSERDQKAIQDTAQLVTLQSWMTIGNEDAKALQFYRDHGNEIIELDASVQARARKLADEWAAKAAKDDPWFDKVWKNQLAFEKLWKDAASYRNVQSGH
jgi:TRAP-type mannitol/chloroaromatic compound transport system substrate-binding protein